MTVLTYEIATALSREAPVSGSTEDRQWLMWISDAEMLIRARLGDLTALNQDVLAYVVREAVVAQIRRPDDATQVSVTVDDGSVQRSYRTARGRVTILDEWWALLSPAKAAKAYVVDLMPVPASVDSVAVVESV